jgi:predicted amidophosphoribosyltransferase
MTREAYYGICPKPGCNVIKPIGYTRAHYPDANPCYCPKCGSQLLTRCPHCRREIEHKEGSYCFRCGKPMKPQVKVLRARPRKPRTTGPHEK